MPGSTVPFTWSTGCGVSQYWIWIGSSAATADLYSQSQGTNLSGTITGLPTDGRTLFVRLWSFINGAWLFNDYTYTAGHSAAGVPAQILSPAPGSTLPGATVPFTWNTGSGVSQYWIWIGSCAATAGLYSQSQGTNLSGTITGLPTDGRTLFVRLWSFINGAWQFNDYTYTAATGGTTSACSTYSNISPTNCTSPAGSKNDTTGSCSTLPVAGPGGACITNTGTRTNWCPVNYTCFFVGETCQLGC